MRISGTTGTVMLLVALAGVGGGGFFLKNAQENKKLELQRASQETRLKAKEAEAKARDAEAKAKAAEERTAAARQKTAEADKARAEADRDKAKTEAQRAAAEAETKKSEAAKAASEAALAEQAKRAEAEGLALQKAEAERKAAEAKLATTVAAKRIADAALAKSENERKEAEAVAAAEHDRKLRMYQRAGTSRAEMLSLQRAERLLALDEAGMLPADGAGEAETVPAAAPATAETAQAATNAVVAVTWPETGSAETPAGARVSEAQRRLEEKTVRTRRARAREYVQTFGELIDRADREGRALDAAHYRRTLVALVPDYVQTYVELIDEARKAGRKEVEARACGALVALIPDWQRVAVFAQLIQRDETYYGRALAGRVTKEEFVRAFRKLYDEARRDKGDRDERDQKVAHICEALAAYVPDFEQSPEWK